MENNNNNSINNKSDKSTFFNILDMRLRKKNIENLEDLKNCYTKVCINVFVAKDNNGKLMKYRRDDLSQWAKEAYDSGDDFFYCEPVDFDNPNGKLQLCKPRYEYRIRNLSEEEFNNIFKDI